MSEFSGRPQYSLHLTGVRETQMLQKVGLPSLADGALLKVDAYIGDAWQPATSRARFQ